MLSVFSSPGHYVQGRDATAVLGAEMVRLGLTGPVLVVAAPSAGRLLGDAWSATFKEAGTDYAVHRFGGECSVAETGRIKQAAVLHRAAVIVGAGGGKALDAARAAAHGLDLPMVSCPTTASNDAPCSALSVLYTEQGAFDSYLLVRRNPALVLVDSSAVVRAPARLFSAGMGDALATWFEARTCVAGRVRNMRGGASTAAAAALSELCHRTLLADGPDALAAVRRQLVTPAVERLIEANTLLSGLGFESSGLAAAHAVHNGLTAVPQTHPYLHGEKVAFGVLTQLVLEGAAGAEIAEVLAFCRRVGLPVTLGGLGLAEADRAVVETIATRATAEGETIHNEPFAVDPRMVADAIEAADALGRASAPTGG
ncbi:glycerol dehydrogenase [Streptacidiphilus cavernicola]|uniref:Glycerol dehydrogenase n=1 Tax=Streptacidiphilus cavernicola TaxID=3342716 RepID=A0ABV6VWM1_9ACTN